MRVLFAKFKNEESGATLVEYGVALIVAIVIGGTALSSLATETDLTMDSACDTLRPADDSAWTVTDTQCD